MLTPRSRRFACCIAFQLAGALTAGCMRTVQLWPLPLEPETPVIVRFAAPRSVVFEREARKDSLRGVSELRGRVLALRHDTLVIGVTRATAGAADPSLFVGWQTTIVVDPSTVVTRHQFDSWKIAYVGLSVVVLLYAALILSGS